MAKAVPAMINTAKFPYPSHYNNPISKLFILMTWQEDILVITVTLLFVVLYTMFENEVCFLIVCISDRLQNKMVSI